MAIKYSREGIYHKFDITYVNGDPIHKDAVFFVINVDSYIGRQSLLAYAVALNMSETTNIGLAIAHLARHQSFEVFNNLEIKKIYNVKRTDNIVKKNAKYYVLRVDEDPLAEVLLKRYALLCRESSPILADDLLSMADLKTWTYLDPDLNID